MPHNTHPEAPLGERLKLLLKERGMTQAQLADRLNVDRTYISQMATGKVNWVNSGYFQQITRILGLSLEEVRALNPDALITVAAPEEEKPGRRGPPVPPIIPFRETPITIPRELLEMVEKHGDTYPVLKTEQMQRMLAAPRNFGGAEVGPQTAEDWFEYWMATKRFLT